jgi:hypothetical protein
MNNRYQIASRHAKKCRLSQSMAIKLLILIICLKFVNNTFTVQSLSVLLINRPTTLLLGRCGIYVYVLCRTVAAGNIETMSLEMGI